MGACYGNKPQKKRKGTSNHDYLANYDGANKYNEEQYYQQQKSDEELRLQPEPKQA